jgi:hypothetical protein
MNDYKKHFIINVICNKESLNRRKTNIRIKLHISKKSKNIH